MYIKCSSIYFIARSTDLPAPMSPVSQTFSSPTASWPPPECPTELKWDVDYCHDNLGTIWV